jgi:hypothetical protein
MGRPEKEYWVGYDGNWLREEGDGMLRVGDLLSPDFSAGNDPDGIDNGGTGSTLLCLWRYTPSWGPCAFFRNI